MVDPVRPQRVEHVAHGLRPRPLAGMDRGPQPERARAQVDAAEGRGRDRLLVAAHPEADDRGQAAALVQVEHAVRRIRAPSAARRRAGSGTGCPCVSSASRNPTSIASRHAPGRGRSARRSRARRRPRRSAVRRPRAPRPPRAPRRRSPPAARKRRQTSAKSCRKLGASRTARRARLEGRRIGERVPGARGETRDLGGGQAALEVEVAVREREAATRRIARVGRSASFGLHNRAPGTSESRDISTICAAPDSSRSFSTCSSRARRPTSPASLLTASSGASCPAWRAGDPRDLGGGRRRGDRGLPSPGRRGAAGPAAGWRWRPGGRTARPPGRWGSIRRNLPLLAAPLEPLRRLAPAPGRRGGTPHATAHRNPYLADNMRVAARPETGAAMNLLCRFPLLRFG